MDMRLQEERPPGNRPKLFIPNSYSSRGKPGSQKARPGPPTHTWHPAQSGARFSESHICQKRADTPNFLYAALERDRVGAFLQGKAHEVHGTHETPQEIGDMAHPSFVRGKERVGDEISKILPGLWRVPKGRHKTPTQKSGFHAKPTSSRALTRRLSSLLLSRMGRSLTR
jgi:hypothetical protein